MLHAQGAVTRKAQEELPVVQVRLGLRGGSLHFGEGNGLLTGAGFPGKIRWGGLDAHCPVQYACGQKAPTDQKKEDRQQARQAAPGPQAFAAPVSAFMLICQPFSAAAVQSHPISL